VKRKELKEASKNIDKRKIKSIVLEQENLFSEIVKWKIFIIFNVIYDKIKETKI